MCPCRMLSLGGLNEPGGPFLPRGAESISEALFEKMLSCVSLHSNPPIGVMWPQEWAQPPRPSSRSPPLSDLKLSWQRIAQTNPRLWSHPHLQRFSPDPDSWWRDGSAETSPSGWGVWACVSLCFHVSSYVSHLRVKRDLILWVEVEILSCNWSLGFSKIERDKKEVGLELSEAVLSWCFPHGKSPWFPFLPFNYMMILETSTKLLGFFKQRLLPCHPYLHIPLVGKKRF